MAAGFVPWVGALALLLRFRLPIPDSGPPGFVSWVVVQGWFLALLPVVLITVALLRGGVATRRGSVERGSAALAPWCLLVAFIGLPALAFVESCDDHRDNYVAGLVPAPRSGTVWTATSTPRPGLFETVTVACGLSPDGSVDEDFDRTNHEIGLARTGQVFLSSNLWGLVEREPIRRLVGPLSNTPFPRSGLVLNGLMLAGRVLVFISVAFFVWSRIDRSRRRPDRR